MNTVQDLKRRRSLFGSLALSLLVIGGLVLGGAPAQAATVDSTLDIVVSGSFTAADGTRFNVSGKVTVRASAVTDAPDVPPIVILTFDATGVKATSGTGGNKKTYDTRGFQVIKTRPLQATDVLTIPIPNVQTGADLTTATTYNATFTLNFNTAGQLTSGTISVSPA